jgi:nucleoside-diphosphate-sugar epimerase
LLLTLSVTSAVFRFSMTATILLTGADGFTGQHFVRAANTQGLEVLELQGNLTDAEALMAELAEARFDFVVHLAGISAVTHADLQDFYSVNLFGTLNLVSAIQASKSSPAKVLLASSANVYGNAAVSSITEQVCPAPLNHYAMSKLAMEQMVKAGAGDLPLVFVRAFNYTGVGHDNRFVIPKMVEHFAQRLPSIELGNMQVEREFNDVRTIVQIYLDLLEKGEEGETYNVCSGRTYNLETVLATLGDITNHAVIARVNPDYLRADELPRLTGDPAKLEACIGAVQHRPLGKTLEWMLRAVPS